MSRHVWVAAIGLALAGCSNEPTKTPTAAAPSPARNEGVIEIPPESPKLAQIRVAEVREQLLPTDEFTAPGKVETNPNRVSKVLLPAPGRIAEMASRFGDAVTKDQVVATLESQEADAAVSAYAQAESEIAQARSAVNKAEADLGRMQDLFKGDAVAKKELLSAETSLAQARASLQHAQTGLQQAAARLELFGLKPGVFRQKIAVRAPLSGKITELSAVAGEYRTDLSASLMTIADLSTVWVSADVPESAIRLVKVGERFDVSLTAFPGEVLQSRVARIADSVDSQSRTIKVWAELANRDGRLRPEMFGQVRHIESLKRVAAAPATAVIQTQGRNVVYRELAKGRFEQTPVEVGRRSGDVVPVVSGLKPGDRVVVDGAMLLRGL